MSYTPLQALETYTELSVQEFHDNAVSGFKAFHKELSTLGMPDGKAVPAVESLLRPLGVECDNDMSFFMMGAMGKFAGDAVSSAFGMAANAPLSMALDVGAGMVSEMSQQNKSERTAFKRTSNENTKKSVFTTRYAKAPVVAPRKPGLLGATSMLRAGTAGRKPAAAPNAEKRRMMLLAQMAKCAEDIKSLKELKTRGVNYACRVPALNEKGEMSTILVESSGKQVAVNNMKTKTSATPASPAGPAATQTAAPKLGMAA